MQIQNRDIGLSYHTMASKQALLVELKKPTMQRQDASVMWLCAGIYLTMNFNTMRSGHSCLFSVIIVDELYPMHFCVRVLWRLNNRKVASRRLSWLVADLMLFRLFMKGKIGAYVLWPLAKIVHNWISDRSSARDFTIL